MHAQYSIYLYLLYLCIYVFFSFSFQVYFIFITPNPAADQQAKPDEPFEAPSPTSPLSHVHFTAKGGRGSRISKNSL